MYSQMTEYNKRILLKDGSELIISKAFVEDAAEIISFLNKLGGETDFLTFGENEFPFSVKEEKDVISEFLKNNTCLMLVGKIKGKIVSHLFIDRSDKERLEHIGDIAVSVEKNHWGKSIGFEMVSFAIEWAKDRKISKLQLQVRTDNDRAINIYKKLGFSEEGRITQSMKIGDTYFDDYIMGLVIWVKKEA
jgi:RimJ/RimL family protein N-acetyltransferase